MYLRAPALTIIRHICHCNQKCSLPFAVLGWHGSSWECLQLGGENQNIFLLLGRLDKRQVVVVVMPLTPSTSALHVSPWPWITTSWGPDLPLSFESRRGPVCHCLGETSWQVHIKSQAAAPTARERCHAQGEIYSLSPLQTPRLAWCRADSSSFPSSATSSSSSGAWVGCLGPLKAECPQGSVPAMALADRPRQPKGSFPKPA